MLSIDNNTFLKYLPNTFTTVEGESTLYEKCEDFLIQGKDLLEEYFISIDMLPPEPTPPAEGEQPTQAEPHPYDGCLDYARRLVCIHAVILAIPTIDLVLTPNGFGIVNSTDVVPASSDRVERLVSMLVKQKNDLMHMLQYKLLQVASWRQSKWFNLWTQTMFGDISSLFALEGSPGKDLIEFYNQAKPKIMAIEQKLTSCFFGKETMDALRTSALLGWSETDEHRLYLASCIVSEIVKMYNGAVPHFHASPFIDYIRKHKSSFPEWEQSQFGQDYEDPQYYENSKEKGGFWFS